MPTRRSLLMVGAAGLAALRGLPAVARPHHPRRPTAADPSAVTDPATTPLGPMDTAAKWALAKDYTSGATLLEKHADEEMAPSSMAKLMTIYIVYSLLKSGRLKLDQELPVSEKAWRTGGSKMFVPYPGSVKVEDLIRGVVVDSGNDACVVFAEAISGSEEQFVELMNETAKKLGLDHSYFRNCNGLPDPEQKMTARDIATLATALIRNFPEYYHYDSEKTFRFNNIEQQNRNPLVQKGTGDGLKTGHTDEGGFGVCASSMRNGRRVILVLNGMTSMHQRAEEAERLMDWAFREFEDVTLFAANQPVEHAPVWLGASPTVPLMGEGALVVTMPRNWQKKAQIAIDYESPIRAPVKKGTVVGKLVVTGQNVPQLNVPLVAGADVPKLSLPGRAVAVVTHYVTGFLPGG
jgi:D-alanyl-D-alanine carboxypeptidase (penicillin-binding protein 5/6)